MAAADGIRRMAMADSYRVESTQPAAKVQNTQSIQKVQNAQNTQNTQNAQNFQSAPQTDRMKAKNEDMSNRDMSGRDGEKGLADSQRRDVSGQIKKAVAEINRKMEKTSCRFGLHEDTNRVMIKIVNEETKEVIKEIPPEETLDIIAKAWELAGLLVDKRL